MAVKLNTEFNYRYQVVGETPWERIKTLKSFLEGRVRAAALEEVSDLKFQAKLSKLKHLQNGGEGLDHEILKLRAEIIEEESHHQSLKEAFELTQDEIKILKKLLDELYVIAEPTRIKGYTDEQMFEANAANEFTVAIGKEIQAEMKANGNNQMAAATKVLPKYQKELQEAMGPEMLQKMAQMAGGSAGKFNADGSIR